MNPRAMVGPVACVAALAGLGVGAGMVQPRAGHAVVLRAGSAPVDAVTLVCPAVTGTAAGLVTTMSVADLGAVLPGGPARVDVTAIPLPGAGQHVPGKAKPGTLLKSFPLSPGPVATVVKKTPYAPVAVTARGPGAAHIVADQVGLQTQGLGRSATDSACLPPAGDWWFAGADGEVGYDETLLLANPTTTLANVAVTAWGATGPLRLAGLDALTLAPRSFVGFKVSGFAPNARAVAIHVHAASGSLVAAVTTRRIYGIHPGGSEWIPPTKAPAADFVVGVVPYGYGTRHLHLANPGNRDATVGLRLVTRTGDFQPAGRQSVVVPAGRTVDVDLSAAITAEPVAIVGTSDQPVIAEARMTAHVRAEYDDMAWVPATSPLTGPAGLAANVAPFNQDVFLELAAPKSAVRVQVATPGRPPAVVTVPAGRTLLVDPRSLLHVSTVGALMLMPLDSGSVYATRVLHAQGAHGPLITSEVPLVLPAPIVLPPVVDDPRAATL